MWRKALLIAVCGLTLARAAPNSPDYGYTNNGGIVIPLDKSMGTEGFNTGYDTYTDNSAPMYDQPMYDQPAYDQPAYDQPVYAQPVMPKRKCHKKNYAPVVTATPNMYGANIDVLPMLNQQPYVDNSYDSYGGDVQVMPMMPVMPTSTYDQDYGQDYSQNYVQGYGQDTYNQPIMGGGYNQYPQPTQVYDTPYQAPMPMVTGYIQPVQPTPCQTGGIVGYGGDAYAMNTGGFFNGPMATGYPVNYGPIATGYPIDNPGGYATAFNMPPVATATAVYVAPGINDMGPVAVGDVGNGFIDAGGPSMRNVVGNDNAGRVPNMGLPRYADASIPRRFVDDPMILIK
ncbi:hypothetical protein CAUPRSCDRAFT_11534 [Caulochytrium protostelioides]|uniref:Uncharacterized protein n=1 Tax=Caulochytrium protostelioides TaxID=1555241 RepID=A0A4P9WU61_9FUNG|nr:hypothetical protein CAUPRSCDRAFT_11534 [Caulochytrium protostelioides]